jgi:hypothetical protein
LSWIWRSIHRNLKILKENWFFVKAPEQAGRAAQAKSARKTGSGFMKPRPCHTTGSRGSGMTAQIRGDIISSAS